MANLTNPDNWVSVEQLNYFKSRMGGGFTDVYIGVGATYSDAMIAANHHDALSKGSLVSVTASSSYLWVILPNIYSPVTQMGGLNVPMAEQSAVTVGNVTYKVLKSSNSYTGTFSISLI